VRVGGAEEGERGRLAADEEVDEEGLRRALGQLGRQVEERERERER